MRDTSKARQQASIKYNAYRTFFDTEEGRLIMTDLMKACHFTDSTVDKTPEMTYYNEGKRSLLIQIMKTAKLKPNEVQKLINQMFDEQQLYGEEF